MPDFPSFDDLFRVAQDEILTRNPRMTLDAVQREGTDANALVAAGAAGGDEVVAQLARVQAGLFLDSAEGDLLDRLVYDRYGLIRKPAAPAIGSVQFSLPSSALASFTIPNQLALQTADGRQFITTQSAIFPAGSSGPLTVPVKSVLAGSDQQANAGVITSITGTVTGAQSGLTVTNILATAGADDAETDQALRDRARRFFTTARRGTLAAIEQAALGVPGIRKATAIEVIDALGRPARFVQLIVADAFVEALATTAPLPATFPTQSQQISTSVFASLDDVRAAGMQVEVFVAQVILLPISLQLRFFAGTDPNQVALLARAAVVGYVNNLAPGQSFSLLEALAALSNVRGLAFFGDEILTPQGDVIVHPVQVVRTTLNLVVASSTVLGTRSQQATLQATIAQPPAPDVTLIPAVTKGTTGSTGTVVGGNPNTTVAGQFPVAGLLGQQIRALLGAGRTVTTGITPSVNLPPVGNP